MIKIIFLKNTIWELLLYVVFLLLPLDNKLLPISIVFFGASSVICFWRSKTELKLNYFSPFFLIFSLIVSSLFWTENLENGFFQIEKRLMWIVAPFLFSIIRVNRRTLLNCFKIYVLVTTTITICFLILGTVTFFFTLDENIKYPIYHYLYNMTAILEKHGVHRIYFSISIVVSMISILVLKIFTFRIKVFLFLFLFMGVLLFQSISILLAILILGIKISYDKVKHFPRKMKTYVFIGLCSLFTIVYLISKKRIDSMIWEMQQKNFVGGSLVERIQYFYASIETIKNSFWLGHGVGDLNNEIYTNLNKLGYSQLASEQINNPHNEFLTIFITTGVVGFSALIFVFFYVFWHSIHFKSKFVTYYAILVFLGCCVESYFSRQVGLVSFLFIIGVMFNYYWNKDDTITVEY